MPALWPNDPMECPYCGGGFPDFEILIDHITACGPESEGEKHGASAG
ncbi:hypothetical protein YDYSY3_57570 [Paenibacillus chitinolyticus]|nr:hypothetical protein YDYSY3_57570 [Paenibacillus chitinolyticus]